MTYTETLTCDRGREAICVSNGHIHFEILIGHESQEQVVKPLADLLVQFHVHFHQLGKIRHIERLANQLAHAVVDESHPLDPIENAHYDIAAGRISTGKYGDLQSSPFPIREKVRLFQHIAFMGSIIMGRNFSCRIDRLVSGVSMLCC